MIRPFEIADAPRCAGIVRACVEQDPLLAADVRRRLLHSITEASVIERSRLYYLAVCELDGSVTGFAGLDLNEIRLLYVAPAQQRRGFGSALLAHVESLVPAALFADVFVYAALSAVEFYRLRNYRAEGEWQVEIEGEIFTTMFMRRPLP